MASCLPGAVYVSLFGKRPVPTTMRSTKVTHVSGRATAWQRRAQVREHSERQNSMKSAADLCQLGENVMRALGTGRSAPEWGREAGTAVVPS